MCRKGRRAGYVRVDGIVPVAVHSAHLMVHEQVPGNAGPESVDRCVAARNHGDRHGDLVSPRQAVLDLKREGVRAVPVGCRVVERGNSGRPHGRSGKCQGTVRRRRHDVPCQCVNDVGVGCVENQHEGTGDSSSSHDVDIAGPSVMTGAALRMVTDTGIDSSDVV